MTIKTFLRGILHSGVLPLPFGSQLVSFVLLRGCWNNKEPRLFPHRCRRLSCPSVSCAIVPVSPCQCPVSVLPRPLPPVSLPTPRLFRTKSTYPSTPQISLRCPTPPYLRYPQENSSDPPGPLPSDLPGISADPLLPTPGWGPDSKKRS